VSRRAGADWSGAGGYLKTTPCCLKRCCCWASEGAPRSGARAAAPLGAPPADFNTRLTPCTPVSRALHLLLAYCHLLAGTRHCAKPGGEANRWQPSKESRSSVTLLGGGGQGLLPRQYRRCSRYPNSTLCSCTPP